MSLADRLQVVRNPGRLRVRRAGRPARRPRPGGPVRQLGCDVAREPAPGPPARRQGPVRGPQAARARRAGAQPGPQAVRRRHHPVRAGAAGPALALQACRGRDRPPDVGLRPCPAHPGDRRRHPRLRPARAVPARPGRHRGHGQRRRRHLRRARRPADADRRRVSPTRPTCAAPSTRSSPGSGAASTRRARWSTPGCPTAAASTRSSRRWRRRLARSRSGSSRADPFTVRRT